MKMSMMPFAMSLKRGSDESYEAEGFKASMDENKHTRGARSRIKPGHEQWARKFGNTRMSRWVEKEYKWYGNIIEGEITVLRWWSECENGEKEVLDAGYTRASFEAYMPKLQAIVYSVTRRESSSVAAPLSKDARMAVLPKASMPTIKTNTKGGKHSINLMDQKPIRDVKDTQRDLETLFRNVQDPKVVAAYRE